MATESYFGGPAAQLSGVEIAEDLAACLIEALQRESELLSSVAYRSYSAKMTVSFQLNALDTVTLDKTVIVGDFDSSRAPDLEIEIESPLASAVEIRDRLGTTAPSLEHSAMEEDGVQPESEPQKKRYYTPRRQGLIK